MARPRQSPEELYDQAKGGSRLALGRLLTMVERGGGDADRIGELAHGSSGGAHIVGITGAPGAGKSTLTGRLVELYGQAGRRPAVLALDPSSPLSGGAILGDRNRMEAIAPATLSQTAAFIRSMATRGHSGGLALAVPLAVRLFDAMGYDPVIIETVGVGQVEVDVVGAADTAVVVATPGMGDAVQANKAGLLEVADIFVVNKADRPGANDVRRDLDLMLDLSHLTGHEPDANRRPPIVMSSALEGQGAEAVVAAIDEHLVYLHEGERRRHRREHRVRTEIRARLNQTLSAMVDKALDSEDGRALVAKAEQGDISISAANHGLLTTIVNPPVADET